MIFSLVTLKMTNTNQSCTYAPLPGYTGGADRNIRERYRSQYSEGDTNMEMFYNSLDPNLPNGSKKENNTLILAMSIACGGLLLIIILMLFFVKPKRR